MLRDAYLVLRDDGLQFASDTDAVWETASLLCADAEDGEDGALTPTEAFVLGCALLVHAAGMDVVRSGEIRDLVDADRWRDMLTRQSREAIDRWPDDTELEDPPTRVLRACAIEAARGLDAKDLRGLVEQRWRLATETEPWGWYRELITAVAASLWRPLDELAQALRISQGAPRPLPADWTVDPLKLACLLRAADATSLTDGRAPTYLAVLGHTGDDPPWGHLEVLGRPTLQDGLLVSISYRAFGRDEAPAWWAALDYLQAVDRQLRDINTVLEAAGRSAFAARGMADVDHPARFAEVFPVEGWLPVDADIRAPDPRRLVASLAAGAWAEPTAENAVRELLLNAQDAVRARQALQPDFHTGRVSVSLTCRQDGWWLTVGDNGVGMCQDTILDGLLVLGRTGWHTPAATTGFEGLLASGFRPAGTTGIGFHTLWAIADRVTITSRRYDHGHDRALRLLFPDGLRTRPVLCPVDWSEPPTRPGTTVEARLKADPTAPDGLLAHTAGPGLAPLIERLIPAPKVPITVETEHNDGAPEDHGERTTQPAGQEQRSHKTEGGESAR